MGNVALVNPHYDHLPLQPLVWRETAAHPADLAVKLPATVRPKPVPVRKTAASSSV